MIATTVLLVSGLMLVYVYGGYLGVLRLLLRIKRAREDGTQPISRGDREPRPVGDEQLPGLTVYVSAYDEEDRIRGRLENLIQQDYPPDRVEIVVVSDGSTDRTEGVVCTMAREHPDRDIRLIPFRENCGQAAAQNLLAKEARHDILVSTDADTVFAESFLRHIASPFLDESVAVAGGTLVYRDLDSDISESMQDYWGYELAVRQAEEELGILTKVSGPCVAYRRRIWRPIEDFEDVDRVVVFFARKMGLRSVHVAEAVCFDSPNSHWKQEIQVRRRMTRKGILSIFHRWRLRDVIREPLFSFGLFSHKVARFPTPAYSAGFVVAGSLVALRGLGPWTTLAAVVSILVVLGAGYAVDFRLARWLTARLKSFALANIGFAWGCVDVVLGNKEGRYRPTRKMAERTSAPRAE